MKKNLNDGMINQAMNIILGFAGKEVRADAKFEISAELSRIAKSEDIKTAEDLAAELLSKYSSLIKIANAGNLNRIACYSKIIAIWATFFGVITVISLVITLFLALSGWLFY